MIRQLVKLCWNRKRSQALVAVEVFFSFLVVFAVMTVVVYNLDNYRRPLGFDYKDVLNVNLGSLSDIVAEHDGRSSSTAREESRRLLREVQELDAVEGAAGMAVPAFDLTGMTDEVEHGGRRFESYNDEVTDDFAQVMRIRVTQGRWFEAADDALPYTPVLVNERLKHDLFGSEDPLGQNIAPKPDEHALGRNGGQAPEFRVVGVFTDFREDGELQGPEPYFLKRSRVAGAGASPYYNLVVRVRPGTPASFEERLLERLRAVSPGHTFQVDPLTKMRRSMMTLKLVPLLAAALVAGFMLVMVALGMVGVLWQSVARRRREIGLRRALGATGRGVSLQVLGELLVVATAGLLVGVALAVQFPLLGVVGWVSTGVYATAIALAALVIYGLTVVAALYPSWLATQVQPAEALHYE
ncbi:MAG TPA: ABC transporter permease [Vicinamibacteria bacterium]|nr:ABC transporter permease [Vicinamibacteria bacterium]